MESSSIGYPHDSSFETRRDYDASGSDFEEEDRGNGKRKQPNDDIASYAKFAAGLWISGVRTEVFMFVVDNVQT
jgi:hypothetical protein